MSNKKRLVVALILGFIINTLLDIYLGAKGLVFSTVIAAITYGLIYCVWEDKEPKG